MTPLRPKPIPPSLLLNPPQDGARFRNFAGISPARYRHPKDRTALEFVRSNGGIDELVRLFSEHLQERASRVDNLANSLRLSRRQLPGLYAICLECCERLGVNREVEFFLGQGNNAWTSGVERPCIVLGHELLAEAASPDLVRFIVGHELGHIISEHVHFHQVAEWAIRVSGSIPVVGGLFQRGLSLALFDWYRASELTADRAGFLACQDLESASRVLMLFAGYPPSLVKYFDVAECEAQEEAFREESRHVTSKLLRFNAEAFMSHPWPIVRTAELSRWSGSDEYAQLFSETLALPGAGESPFKPELVGRICPACSAALYPGDRFCTECGAPAGHSENKTAP